MGDAIETVGLRMQQWTEQSQRYRFLSLWRELCQDYGWEEQARQTEGLLFDYRMPTVQRRVTLEEHPKQRLDPGRQGLMATRNGAWLLDISREGIRTWDTSTGAEGPFWSVECPIVDVVLDDGSQVVIATLDGTLYRWDVMFDFHQELDRVDEPLLALGCRQGRIVGWSNNYLYCWDDAGVRKQEIVAKFRTTPCVAISHDLQRVMACDGSTLGVWSAITGSVIYGQGFHSGLTPDTMNMVESLLDMGSTVFGLRLLDKLDVWGLKLQSQYELIRTLSAPIVCSATDQYVVMGDESTLAWLEWDAEEEEYVILTQMDVPNLWSLSNVQALSGDCRVLVGLTSDGLAVLDIARNKDARYPLEIPLAAKMTVIPTLHLIACDDTRRVSLYIFRGD
jgi:hypothetical protein